MSSIANFTSLHSSIFHVIFFNSNSFFFGSSNGVFSCDCPRGFDGVHCEVVNTQAPSAGPTIQLPTEIELVSPSTSASLPRKWHTLVFVVPFVVFSF